MFGTWVAYFDDPTGEPSPALVSKPATADEPAELIVFGVETVPAEGDAPAFDVARAHVARVPRDQWGKAAGAFWCTLGELGTG